MRRHSSKLVFLIAALLTFSFASVTDYTLRANVGPQCFGCSNLACKIVVVADNPLFALQHPIDTINEFLQ